MALAYKNLSFILSLLGRQPHFICKDYQLRNDSNTLTKATDTAVLARTVVKAQLTTVKATSENLRKYTPGIKSSVVIQKHSRLTPQKCLSHFILFLPKLGIA